MEIELGRFLSDAQVARRVEALAKKWMRDDSRRQALWRNSEVSVSYRSIGSKDERFPANCLAVVPRIVVGIAKKRQKSHVALAFAERARCFTRVHLFGTVPLAELEKNRRVFVESVSLGDEIEEPEDEEIEDHHPPRDRRLLERVNLESVALERVEQLALPRMRRKSIPGWLNLLGRHLLAACLCSDDDYETLIELETEGASGSEKLDLVAFFDRAKRCYAGRELGPKMTELRRDVLEAKKLHFGTTNQMDPE